jgi:hypothetical protein
MERGASDADRRLITAAPEMLEALKLLANEDNYLSPSFSPAQIAIDAITKTKGE